MKISNYKLDSIWGVVIAPKHDITLFIRDLSETLAIYLNFLVYSFSFNVFS